MGDEVRDAPAIDPKKKRGRPNQVVSLQAIYAEAKDLASEDREKVIEFIKKLKNKDNSESIEVVE